MANVVLQETSSDSFQVFYLPSVPVKWPTFTPLVNACSNTLDPEQTFWRINHAVPGICTNQGKPTPTCTGRTVETTLLEPGTYDLTASLNHQSTTFSVEITAAFNGPRTVRPEVRDLHLDNFKQVRQAFLDKKRNGVWDHFVQTRMISFDMSDAGDLDTNVGHGGPAFLAWHRRLLKLFLLRILGNPAVGLPFCYWTLDSANPAHRLQITSGPVCSTVSANCHGHWRLKFYSTTPGLTRQLTDVAQVQAMIDMKFYDVARFNTKPVGTAGSTVGFCAAVEGYQGGLGHNGVHRWIYRGRESGNEPHFVFMPHNQVDLIFQIWLDLMNCSDGFYSHHTKTVTVGTVSAIKGRIPGHHPHGRIAHWMLTKAPETMDPKNAMIRQVLYASAGLKAPRFSSQKAANSGNANKSTSNKARNSSPAKQLDRTLNWAFALVILYTIFPFVFI